jgi:activator of HSP90 ATPase
MVTSRTEGNDMATYDFVVSDVVSAPRAEVYDAWLSSEGHSEMTGGTAVIDAREGGSHSAWNGYITGTTTLLDAPHRVVQSWRSADFSPDDPDSTIDVTFEEVEEGTRVTIRHSRVPIGQRGYEEGGWATSYFEPMKAFFRA